MKKKNLIIIAIVIVFLVCLVGGINIYKKVQQEKMIEILTSNDWYRYSEHKPYEYGYLDTYIKFEFDNNNTGRFIISDWGTDTVGELRWNVVGKGIKFKFNEPEGEGTASITNQKDELLDSKVVLDVNCELFTSEHVVFIPSEYDAITILENYGAEWGLS